MSLPLNVPMTLNYKNARIIVEAIIELLTSKLFTVLIINDNHPEPKPRLESITARQNCFLNPALSQGPKAVVWKQAENGCLNIFAGQRGSASTVIINLETWNDGVSGIKFDETYEDPAILFLPWQIEIIVKNAGNSGFTRYLILIQGDLPLEEE